MFLFISILVRKNLILPGRCEALQRGASAASGSDAQNTAGGGQQNVTQMEPISTEWFKGTSIGNHGFYHQIKGFPVNFPIIQFYDDMNG